MVNMDSQIGCGQIASVTTAFGQYVMTSQLMCTHLGQQVVLEGLTSSSGENRGSQRDRLRTDPVMVSSIALVQAVARLHSVRNLANNRRTSDPVQVDCRIHGCSGA